MTTYPTESNAQSGGYYMQNLVSIAEFLEGNGYSQAAAAGIAGTIAGESGGNPESVGSGGNGLIGWTPPIPSYVTGNDQTDFQNQLIGLIQYADSNSAEAVARGGVNLATLKQATDPNQAATWWSEFEGPQVPGSDVRNAVVSQIYSNLNGYKPNSGYSIPAGLDAQPGSPSSPGGSAPTTQCAGIQLPGFLGGSCLGVEIPTLAGIESDIIGWLEQGALMIFGAILVIIGIIVLVKGQNKTQVNLGNAGKTAGVAKDAEEGAEVAAVA